MDSRRAGPDGYGRSSRDPGVVDRLAVTRTVRAKGQELQAIAAGLKRPGDWAYLQISLNDLWRAEADLLPGQSPLPSAPDALPPRLAEDPSEPATVGDEPAAPEVA